MHCKLLDYVHVLHCISVLVLLPVVVTLARAKKRNPGLGSAGDGDRRSRGSRIWARAAVSCRSQAECPPGAARRHASGRREGVPSGRIRVGGGR